MTGRSSPSCGGCGGRRGTRGGSPRKPRGGAGLRGAHAILKRSYQSKGLTTQILKVGPM